MKNATFILLSFLMCFTVHTNAQSKTAESRTSALMVRQLGEKQLEVSFEVSSPVQNSIVAVRDNKGDLIFMDIKHRFSGKYEKMITLPDGQAKYTVHVKNDDEDYTRNISMTKK